MSRRKRGKTQNNTDEEVKDLKTEEVKDLKTEEVKDLKTEEVKDLEEQTPKKLDLEVKKKKITSKAKRGDGYYITSDGRKLSSNRPH